MTYATLLQRIFHLLTEGGSLYVAIVAALATAYFTNIFYQRREKTKKITEAASNMLAYGMRYKATYTKFAEYNGRFQRTQAQLGLHSPSGPIFGHLQQVAMVEQASAFHYEKELSLSQDNLRQSAYMLAALLNRQITEDDKFNDALKSVIGFSPRDPADSSAVAREIESELVPNLAVMESACLNIIYKHNTHWLTRLVDSLANIRSIPRFQLTNLVNCDDF